MPNIGKQRYQGLNEDFAVVTGVTAAEADVLATKIFVNAARATVTGTMVNKTGLATPVIIAPTAANSTVIFTVPAVGYYTATSTITATDAQVATAIELTADKLKSGITVLGITGTP